MKIYRFPKGRLVHGSCIDVLQRVKPSSIDLVFADPPFNIGYDYDEYEDKMPPGKYLAWCKTWINLCRLALKPTGSMFVAIGDEYAAQMKLLLDKSGMHWRNWIIWHYTFGVYCKSKFGRDHAHILYYTNHPKKFTFNGQDILVPSARQSVYNDRRAVAGGRVPGDVWLYPRVCGTFKERTGHPCQMPEALLERIVQVASSPGDVVLDPFAGSGTSAAVAQRLGRRFVTSEISKRYCRMIANRLRITTR